MMVIDGLEEMRCLCADARYVSEGSNTYVYIPSLKLCNGRMVQALLCLTARDGYTTRLFLSEPIAGKGANWTTHRILDKTWHTWSWNQVLADQRPIEILADHLRALR
jgi:hypothetical protein